jgi:hypothetical protein
MNRSYYAKAFALISFFILGVTFQNCGQSQYAQVDQNSLDKFDNAIAGQNNISQSLSKTGSVETIIQADPNGGSQYSPFVFRLPGWGSKLMFYCKNNPIGGWWRDRMWRGEQWDNSTWNAGLPVLQGIHPANNDELSSGLVDNDDLTCSPGVVYWQGKLLSYNVTARRDRDMDLYILKASSLDNGQTWQKEGGIEINQLSFPILTGRQYVETPSPILEGNSLSLYLTYSNANNGQSDQKLYRITSLDGQQFTHPELIRTQSGPNVSHGRVIKTDGIYIYAYSEPGPERDPLNPVLPNSIYLEFSKDGMDFTAVPRVDMTQLIKNEGKYLFSPMPWIENNQLKIYFAASNGSATGCWMCGGKLAVLNTSISIDEIKSELTPPTFSAATVPQPTMAQSTETPAPAIFPTAPAIAFQASANPTANQGSPTSNNPPINIFTFFTNSGTTPPPTTTTPPPTTTTPPPTTTTPPPTTTTPPPTTTTPPPTTIPTPPVASSIPSCKFALDYRVYKHTQNVGGLLRLPEVTELTLSCDNQNTRRSSVNKGKFSFGKMSSGVATCSAQGFKKIRSVPTKICEDSAIQVNVMFPPAICNVRLPKASFKTGTNFAANITSRNASKILYKCNNLAQTELPTLNGPLNLGGMAPGKYSCSFVAERLGNPGTFDKCSPTATKFQVLPK